jgi:SAM-dependent methyltransferase
MRTRESGMPPEDVWNGFFDAQLVLAKLGLTADHSCVVDFGCGYGTFSVPAARLVGGTVHAVDMDPGALAAVRAKAEAQGLANLEACERDFMEDGCGLPGEAADYALLFNILHAERPDALLREAKRVLKRGGTLAVTHWNYDPSTPRGPSMEIRLRPEQCMELVALAGFEVDRQALIDLPPYHYGFVGKRPA